MSDINTILEANAEAGVDLRKNFLESLNAKQPADNSEAVETALEEMFGTSEGFYPAHKEVKPADEKERLRERLRIRVKDGFEEER